jgi:hypothetical protein
LHELDNALPACDSGMRMLQRLRSNRILTAASLPLAAMWFLSLSIHTHKVDGIDTQTAALQHVPIGVISNPDAPSPDAHWHPGTLVHEEPCVACLLSHQPGSVGAAFVLLPTVVACRTSLVAPRAVPQPRGRAASARAPPISS